MDVVISRYKSTILSLPALPLSYITVESFDDEWQSTLSEHSQQNSILPFAQSKCYSIPIDSSRLLTNSSRDVKPVYEIVLDIKDVSDFSYNPGDTVGVLPINSESEVSYVIKSLGFVDTSDRKISLKLSAGSKKKLPNYLPAATSIRNCLTDCLDLHSIPKKLFLRSLLEHLMDDNEKRFLEILCSKEGSIEYSEMIVNAKTIFLDLLKMFHSWHDVPFQLLLEHLPRLLPRPYSIANSPLNNRHSLRIWFSVNDPPGITTKMLQDFVTVNDRAKPLVPIYLRQSNSFQYTTNEMKDPVILIASGVGVSPFLGFLEHREYVKDFRKDICLGDAHMFYGSRHENESLCKVILRHHLRAGSLNELKEAFSRDSDSTCKYVQDQIEANGASFVELVKDNCRIYVCGSERMVQCIQNCFIDFLTYSDTEAVNFMQKLLMEKRYIEDTWR